MHPKSVSVLFLLVFLKYVSPNPANVYIANLNDDGTALNKLLNLERVIDTVKEHEKPKQITDADCREMLSKQARNMCYIRVMYDALNDKTIKTVDTKAGNCFSSKNDDEMVDCVEKWLKTQPLEGITDVSHSDFQGYSYLQCNALDYSEMLNCLEQWVESNRKKPNMYEKITDIIEPKNTHLRMWVCDGLTGIKKKQCLDAYHEMENEKDNKHIEDEKHVIEEMMEFSDCFGLDLKEATECLEKVCKKERKHKKEDPLQLGRICDSLDTTKKTKNNLLRASLKSKYLKPRLISKRGVDFPNKNIKRENLDFDNMFIKCISVLNSVVPFKINERQICFDKVYGKQKTIDKNQIIYHQKDLKNRYYTNPQSIYRNLVQDILNVSPKVIDITPEVGNSMSSNTIISLNSDVELEEYLKCFMEDEVNKRNCLENLYVVRNKILAEKENNDIKSQNPCDNLDPKERIDCLFSFFKTQIVNYCRTGPIISLKVPNTENSTNRPKDCLTQFTSPEKIIKCLEQYKGGKETKIKPRTNNLWIGRPKRMTYPILPYSRHIGPFKDLTRQEFSQDYLDLSELSRSLPPCKTLQCTLGLKIRYRMENDAPSIEKPRRALSSETDNSYNKKSKKKIKSKPSNRFSVVYEDKDTSKENTIKNKRLQEEVLTMKMSLSSEENLKKDSVEGIKKKTNLQKSFSGKKQKRSKKAKSAVYGSDEVLSIETERPSMKYSYMQGNKIVDVYRKRLQQFLPKRVHFEPSDFHNLGPFWLNAPLSKWN